MDVVLVANTRHGVDDVEHPVKESIDALDGAGRLIGNWHDQPRATLTVDADGRGPPRALRKMPAETDRAPEDVVGATLRRQVELPPYHYGLVFA